MKSTPIPAPDATSPLVFLDALTRDDCRDVRIWRNAIHDLGMLRTTRRLTEQEQMTFFDEVVTNPRSPHRYFAVRLKCDYPTNVPVLGKLPATVCFTQFVGMVGLTNIDADNGAAEISLIVSPNHRRQGIGARAVDLVLEEAFDRMRLLTVYGEVYHCNEPGVTFWAQVIEKHKAIGSILPRRKFWNGRLYSATYFAIPAPEARAL